MSYELVLSDCGAGEDSWQSLGQQGQSVLREIDPEYSLEGLMLKLQCFGHLMGRDDSLEDSDAGQDRRQKEKGAAEDEIVR